MLSCGWAWGIYVGIAFAIGGPPGIIRNLYAIWAFFHANSTSGDGIEIIDKVTFNFEVSEIKHWVVFNCLIIPTHATR